MTCRSARSCGDVRPPSTVVPPAWRKVSGTATGWGVVTSGDWVLQNPMFGGYSAVAAYLPSKRVAIGGVVATYKAEAFDASGEVPNRAQDLFRLIGAAAAPDDAPPVPHP